MKFVKFRKGNQLGIGVFHGSTVWGLLEGEPRFPGDLTRLIAGGAVVLKAAAEVLLKGDVIDLDTVTLLPPVGESGKFICLGINYPAHSAEVALEIPKQPTIFARFPSGFIGCGADMVRPAISHQLDFEGELLVVLGKGGRHIAEKDALSHVAGYSIFNDGTIRDYQIATPQWTAGKNFDGTGAIGPYFVTAEELPPGGINLILETRLNGRVVQHANTSEMTFGVAKTIAFLSEIMTLEPSDAIALGTPDGVGFSRTPPLYMKPGDICEVEITGLGVLRNFIVDEGGYASLSKR
ncbi:fumarylacetoacetate hydrolase family protein [Paraburkholderia rhizosphaerae]|uniref:2-keto-4-pentenoate hydratase/2-oxohepta-3-ene-1,7-dioic acid hydratase in catechol pathway n=1 Tax=Paraburkholderia rhizosphaerae TaxID=480658 RepID=A0A4V3HCG3_9BURK|nr:fumarylacetoacetate hydrolase family protein [Paraburkholderia rhizosphaerae]TDY37054.1 2-keto-4-pentenoate hydratase/2-oxohepta-3-ene-1,7-dioic acid hydratase in catechol pathway [Paraburkholderia rhizosphaerae]